MTPIPPAGLISLSIRSRRSTLVNMLADDDLRRCKSAGFFGAHRGVPNVDSRGDRKIRWFHIGSNMKPMPTLTLKNIPKTLHARLRQSAEKNRRSLNSEILARLESELVAPTIDSEAHARALKAFTAKLPRVEHAKVGRYKRQGRA